MAGQVYKMLPVETIRGCPFIRFCNSPDQMRLYKGVEQIFIEKKNGLGLQGIKIFKVS